MTDYDEMKAALAPYYAAARHDVENDPAMADVVARAADEESSGTWFYRNRIALEVEARMPSIPVSVAIIRRARRRGWFC